MGAAVLTTSDVILCPHGGQVMLLSSQSQVTADGGQALRPGDTFLITGCAFSTPGGPHPCVTVEWQNPAQKVSVVSQSVLTRASVGLCKAGDQAVQGVVLIQQTQMKVSAL